MSKIYLASKSPRRRALLEQLGVSYDLLDIDVPEEQINGETALAYIKRVATDKALAGTKVRDKRLAVLAADTEVILDKQIMGKPADYDAAISMLSALSGRVHEVVSVVVLVTAHNETHTQINQNKVYFKTLSKEECEHYCTTDEPWDKAGAYGIQGKAATFITRIEGSCSGIMGLPLYETSELLKMA